MTDELAQKVHDSIEEITLALHEKLAELGLGQLPCALAIFAGERIIFTSNVEDHRAMTGAFAQVLEHHADIEDGRANEDP